MTSSSLPMSAILALMVSSLIVGVVAAFAYGWLSKNSRLLIWIVILMITIAAAAYSIAIFHH